MRDHVQHQQAGALPARIDSVDVAQLLRDIGEASASTNPVDLFRLCLGAQRVLGRVLGEPPAVASLHPGGRDA
ncbi:hypothetical protein HH212_12045 [Massilia forsythiae]|uniref:Uncharacterized protein n=1 Tax=Massilia forsythiae TaxID=2728020 RepID=A0A7Z2VWG1_9BURK|nr:hypothetical protein [Massilia forsythiae]QJE00661.1 hypothetical protein HH212_12045 [Massilia forsythiae]